MAFEADLKLDVRADGSIDVSDGEGHWITFTLDDLRQHLALPRVDMICGDPVMPPSDALEFVTIGHAMARELAVRRKLIPGP